MTTKAQHITLSDFTLCEVPFEQLKEFSISYPHEETYNGKVHILEDEVSVENLFLDDLMEEDARFFVFRKEVKVANLLAQQETDYGPVVIFQDNVVAKNIWAGGGDIIFEKSVTVEQTFIGVYNHGETTVQEAVKGEIIISDDHYMAIKGTLEGHTYGEIQENEHPAEDLFLSKYYDKWEEQIDTDKIWKAMLKGESIVSKKEIVSPLQKRINKMQASKVKRLDLSYMDNLEEIPAEVWSLSEITSLDVSGNFISSIPDDIAKLGQLKTLKLNNCEFTSFPQSLLKLDGLEELEMNENKVSELPEAFVQLKRLKRLDISNCLFKDLPTSLYKLELKKLDLSGNMLSRIERPLPKLTELNIAQCGFTELPTVIAQMVNLSVLNMMQNHLATFPSIISELKKLKELGVDLVLLDEQSVQVLSELAKLQTLRINNQNSPDNKLEVLLGIDNWSKLILVDTIEDMFVGKKILERKNLALLEIKETKLNIKEQRKMLNISI